MAEPYPKPLRGMTPRGAKTSAARVVARTARVAHSSVTNGELPSGVLNRYV